VDILQLGELGNGVRHTGLGEGFLQGASGLKLIFLNFSKIFGFYFIFNFWIFLF
jgi:hypothetical protein